MLRVALLFLLIPLFPVPQKHSKSVKEDGGFSIRRNGSLPEELSEISGWIFVNDTTLIAHNDSGNGAFLYVLKTDGSILHKCRINAKNIDWEDITFNGKDRIYIGDIGNNNNTRKDLRVLEVNLNTILLDTLAEPKIIRFSYPEQKAFPADSRDKYYDAEAIAYRNDSLWIVTKCRTSPFNGKAMIYKIPAKEGEYQAKLSGYIVPGKTTWLKDGITAAEFKNDLLYVLTYNRALIYSVARKEPKLMEEIKMNPISQKEALAIHRKDGSIFIADERQKLIGGGNIFIVSPKN